MQPVVPIETVELFPGLSAHLLRVLKHLPDAAWDRPTACPTWSVKDVVAHLLGGNLGRLSHRRDKRSRSRPDVTLTSYTQLVDMINQENAEWVNAARRISPRLLIQFLELTDPQLYQYFKALPPFEVSGPAVAWAGDTQSPNWFDIAREYTEKWLHQQHVREAVGQPLLVEREWLFPALDTFMRALPHTYRDMHAADGVAVCFHISGEAGGDWALLRREHTWQLCSGEAPAPIAAASLDQDTAWRLFTHGISRDAARAKIQTTGDAALGMKILDMVSIMA